MYDAGLDILSELVRSPPRLNRPEHSLGSILWTAVSQPLPLRSPLADFMSRNFYFAIMRIAQFMGNTVTDNTTAKTLCSPDTTLNCPWNKMLIFGPLDVWQVALVHPDLCCSSL